MTIVSALFVLSIVVALNFLAVHNDREFDFTRERLYTLTDQTQRVLGRLEQEVIITAFYSTVDDKFSETQESLERYAQSSAWVKFSIVDPYKADMLVEKHKITDRGPRIVVQCGDRDARAPDASETELTNAIIKVVEQTEKSLAFLTGHGEATIDDQDGDKGLATVAELLRAEGYRVKDFSLMGGADDIKSNVSKSARLEDAATPESVNRARLELQRRLNAHAVLVITTATSALSTEELEIIQAYLELGGRVVAMLEPRSDTGVEGLIEEKWKIHARADLIIDPNEAKKLYGYGPGTPMIYPATDKHPVVANMKSAAVMSLARSLELTGKGGANVEPLPLLRTDPYAWGETTPVTDVAELDEQDFKGPLTVAVAATMHIPTHLAERRSDEARLIVFGDSDWIGNNMINEAGNADLIVNAINWLAEEEDRISIGRKSRDTSVVFFTVGQLGVLKIVTLDLLWLTYIALGLGIVLIRRQR